MLPQTEHLFLYGGKECGVNPKQLTYEGKGNAANVYENNQKANRAVIIK